MANDNEPVSANELSPTPAKQSKADKVKQAIGRVFTVVTRDPKLRAILAGGIAAGFAIVGLKVDGDTALAMIGAAGLLAGWGPNSADAG